MSIEYEQIITELAGRNPGARLVCDDLARDFGADAFLLLRKYDIKNLELYLMFTDVYRKDIFAMVKGLRDGSVVEKLSQCSFSHFYNGKRE